MHVDLDLSDALVPYESTVCIVGGGIAGLVLATRLATQGVDVHLLEAGGLEQESRSQAFYVTEQPRDSYRGTTDGRFRTFGGSSTMWGAQLLPFTHDIFVPGEGCPSRPWPVTEDDLTPFYRDIESIFQVDPLPFDAGLLTALGHPQVLFSSDISLRFSKWARFQRRNLAQTIGADALADPRITVFTHANVAELETADGAVSSVRVLNYAGQEYRFSARHFVVAAGTVESSRLLLMSPQIPNPHDQLGRYFNDHLSFHAGVFESPEREAILDRLGPFFVDGTLHTCKLEASETARSRERLYSAMAHVIVEEPEDSGTAAIRNLLRSVQMGKLQQAAMNNLVPVVLGLGDVVRLLFYAKFKQRRAVSRRAQVRLNVDIEQAPDANNRIRLSDRKDALGLPIAVVDWRVNAEDQQTAMRFARMIRPELERLKLAPASWDDSLTADRPPQLHDTFHAMGGLCMGTDAATSVVDRDLKLHQLSNLHVASCAVFPSGSCSNPTFTLMALAMRLGDRLVRELG